MNQAIGEMIHVDFRSYKSPSDLEGIEFLVDLHVDGIVLINGRVYQSDWIPACSPMEDFTHRITYYSHLEDAMSLAKWILCHCEYFRSFKGLNITGVRVRNFRTNSVIYESSLEVIANWTKEGF